MNQPIKQFLKRTITKIVLIFTLLLPAIALAQPVDQCTMSHDVGILGCPASGICNFQTNQQCGICCIMNAVFTVTDWIFYILVALMTLLVILGIFTMSTAGGDPSKVNRGRNYILYVMLGFAIALLSRAIPALVKTLLGL